MRQVRHRPGELAGEERDALVPLGPRVRRVDARAALREKEARAALGPGELIGEPGRRLGPRRAERRGHLEGGDAARVREVRAAQPLPAVREERVPPPAGERAGEVDRHLLREARAGRHQHVRVLVHRRVPVDRADEVLHAAEACLRAKLGVGERQVVGACAEAPRRLGEHVTIRALIPVAEEEDDPLVRAVGGGDAAREHRRRVAEGPMGPAGAAVVPERVRVARPGDLAVAFPAEHRLLGHDGHRVLGAVVLVGQFERGHRFEDLDVLFARLEVRRDGEAALAVGGQAHADGPVDGRPGKEDRSAELGARLGLGPELADRDAEAAHVQPLVVLQAEHGPCAQAHPLGPIAALDGREGGGLGAVGDANRL